MSRRLALAAAALGLAGAAALGTTAAAHADPAGIGVVQNTAGEAGYFVNSNNHTRIRDAQATIPVVNQIKNLNGTGTNDGGLGPELCDPNTGFADQLGVLWDGTAFQVEYGYGTLAPGSDPCIQSGLLQGMTSHLHLMNAPAVNLGDVLRFDLFFQPAGTHHYTKFGVCDVTGDWCRVATVFNGWHNFYEAGIGAVSNAAMLTAPAANLLDSFSALSFNYYSSTHALGSIYVPSHWQLKRADWVNGSSQVIMSSNGSLNAAGTAFSLFEGSTSP
jgi:hypothetical protein